MPKEFKYQLIPGDNSLFLISKIQLDKIKPNNFPSIGPSNLVDIKNYQIEFQLNDRVIRMGIREFTNFASIISKGRVIAELLRAEKCQKCISLLVLCSLLDDEMEVHRIAEGSMEEEEDIPHPTIPKRLIN